MGKEADEFMMSLCVSVCRAVFAPACLAHELITGTYVNPFLWHSNCFNFFIIGDLLLL